MASVTRQLQVGQKVSVHELETGCQLCVLDGTANGLTVVENAPDYVVLEDAAGEVLTRIPSYLVRTVTGLPAAVVAEEPEPVVEAPASEPVVEAPASEPVAAPSLPPLELEPVIEVPAAVVPEAA